MNLSKAEKARRFDILVKEYGILNNDNDKEVIRKFGEILNGQSKEDIIDKTENVIVDDNGALAKYTFPFPEDTDIRQLYKEWFGKTESYLVYCFKDVFCRLIDDGIYKKDELLPPPKAVAAYMKKSSKQTERKVREAYMRMTNELRHAVTGTVISAKRLTNLGNDRFVVDFN